MIVSGGQTGAERAALDWAIQARIPHGGWCPRGRKAEDGPLATQYALQEMASTDYSARTRQNVIDSDGTLIVNTGELEGGTLKTLRIAEKLRKPHLLLQMDVGVQEANVHEFVCWMRRESISRLNIAGPRASKQPDIYRLVRELLDQTAAVFYYPIREERLYIGGAGLPPGYRTYTPPTHIRDWKTQAFRQNQIRLLVARRWPVR